MGCSAIFACQDEPRTAPEKNCRTMVYVAALHKRDAHGYGVSFPDFPGYLLTAIGDVEEAVDAARDALALIVQELVEDGRMIPAPARLDDVLDDPDFFGSLAFMHVEVDCFY